MQKIVALLHPLHGILENILDIASEEKVERISEQSNLDPEDGLRFLEREALIINDLAKEVEIKLSQCREKERKEKSRMESMISSLMKENQDTRSMLEVATTEEVAENSLPMFRADGDQRRSAILQINEKGLQKVGFGFIMEVIGGESQGEEMSSCGASMVASNGRESKQEVDSLVSTK
ncbi:uncharacterized protein [Lolium perenne]|uniref:uncharacterized protein n=1 Tax=Lolium perenne TaxID=4522 RepID=UPI003A99929B